MSAPLVFRMHAIQRMAERSISLENIRQVLETGERVEDYPDDFPYPSSLVLGWVEDRPIHIVVARAPEKRIVITVYQPDPARWMPDFKTRRS